MRVHVLNGVNLNMLGKRDPAQYGSLALDELETQIYAWGADLGLTVRCDQSNLEGEYIGMIHTACEDTDGLIVNPGAWTHYSYAIRDALEIFSGPIVEVHLSAIETREPWRRHSVMADVVSHRITGHGADGYHEALDYLSRSSQ
jgi:3-dehydroquinate dehydratase II